MVRFKNRYFLFEQMGDGNSAANPSPKSQSHTFALLSDIRSAIQSQYGDHGLGMMGAHLAVKYYNSALRVGVLRCARDHQREMRAVLAMMNGARVLRVWHVAGTIRSCQKEMLKRLKKWSASGKECMNRAKLDHIERDLSQMQP